MQMERWEFFFLLLHFLPKRSYHRPSPTPMHKDEKQNFQKSENLIYFKGKRKSSQLCVHASQPLLPRRRDES